MVDVCFADRTFSNVDNMVKNYRYVNILYFFFRLFFFGESDITQDFIKVISSLLFTQAKCFKIISADPKDSVVKDNISLKSSISKEIVYLVS